MCTRPLKCFQNPTGGRPIFGWEGVKLGLPELQLPCGKCPECMKDYYSQWATRGSRELMNWESSLFITLTYNDENLPGDGSLSKTEIQNFVKRVKKYFRSSLENPIRQIYCGEYGTKGTQRPHYHVILFNCDFADKKPHRKSDKGKQIYVSDALSRLWGKGHCEFGFAEPGSIAYLFKYVLKRKSRREKSKPLIIERDGITYEVEHEFVEGSRNPGIGACLRDSASLRKGYLTVNGVRKKIPKYYLEHIKKTDPELAQKIADSRYEFAKNLPVETLLRREQKEEAQKKLTDTKKKL